MKKKFKPGYKNSGKKKQVKKTAEQGTIFKRGKGLIKAALVYPNTYRAGMSSLGFQAVYKVANDIAEVACERVFWEGPRRPQKSIRSIESGLELKHFDVILFSISFENDFFHLVQLLGEAGIPLRSPDRNHIHPLVVAGGVACFLNPQPIAPFIDCFLLGEAECLLPDFFKYFSQQPDKKKFIRSAETQIKGAFCPAAHLEGKSFKIPVRFMSDLKEIKTTSVILTSETAFKNTYLIETLKGCPHGCRFCSAGFIYRPPRVYPATNIIHAIDDARQKTEKIGLVSSAVADHPEINRICDYALGHQLRISFSSLRADKLDASLLESLKNSRIKTATIAPEAGSQRMRDVINKKLSRDQILSAVKKIVGIGIINIRLYFMIGLPFETKADIHAIVELTREIKAVFLDASKKNKKIGTLTLSINPFIPKPFTPFQWAAMDQEPVLKEKAGIIRQGLKKTANVNLNFESFRKARIQALLSLGDTDISDIIQLAVEKSWSFAMKKHQDICNRVIYHAKDPAFTLPWDFLANRIRKDFLLREYNKAQKAVKSTACPMIECSLCKRCMEV